MKKNIFTITILILLSLNLSSCNNTKQEKEVKKSFSTYIVKSGNLNDIGKFIGYTSGNKEVMLATKSPGRIVYLKKDVGDKVYKGELLAQLDSSEAKAGYSTANNIVNSLYALRKQTELAYNGQIDSIKAKIEQAKIGIKGISTGLNDTKNITEAQLNTARTGVEQAKIGLETAEKNLEETKKNLQTKKENILESGKTAITQSVILYKNIIDFSDKLLGITKENEDYNDSFEVYLGAKNSRQLKDTKELFPSVKKEFLEYEKYYNEKIENKNPSEENIIEGLKIAEKTAEGQKKLLKELYTVLDNSIANVRFPISVINEYKKNISNFGSQVENSLLTVDGNFILGIKGTIQNLKDFNSNQEKAITLLKKQVELAQAGLETAKKTLEQYEEMSKGQINGVITKKEIAESQLKEALAGLKAIQSKKEASLKEIDAKITEARGGRVNAGIMINNGKVYSNISGVIIQKFAEEGQVINAGMPIYMVADNSKLKVKTSVPNDYYKNLKIGDKIDLAVEGYNKALKGKITVLSKSANRFTKKYDIEIEINNSKGDIPLGAMTTIVIKKKTDKTKLSKHSIIPNNAIISKFSLPSVFVIENGKAKLKTIKIIKMGKNKSEVTGVKSLEKIITSGKENIFDGEELK